MIIKAVLVQRGIQGYETHHFETLCKLLGVTPAPDEAQLLAFYEDAIFWIGRYPIPKRATHEKLATSYERANSVLFKKTKLSPSMSLELMEASGATDWPQLYRLWLRYANMFEHSNG